MDENRDNAISITTERPKVSSVTRSARRIARLQT